MTGLYTDATASLESQRYRYHAYGLSIASQLPIPEFMPAVLASVDVEICIDLSSNPLTQWPTSIEAQTLAFQVREETIRLYLKDVGLFEIHKGRDVVILPLVAPEDQRLTLALSGVVMAVVLYQRGLFVAHASAVVVDASAILFLGASGAGKSSLALALHRQGYPVLTDDLAAISLQGQQPYLMPAFPQMRLTQEVCQAMGLRWAELLPLPRLDKRGFRFESGFANDPVPLRCIYSLAVSEHTLSCQPMAGHGQIMELMRHSGLMALFSPDRSDHFQACVSLAESVEFFQFSRPLRWDKLPQAIQALEHHWISG